MVGSRPTQSANYGVGSNYVNHLYYGDIMKKILGIVAASALAFSLTGCAGKFDTFQKAYDTCGAPEGITVSDEGKTITINGIGEDDYSGAGLYDTVCVLDAIKTPEYVISNMETTNSLMGRQNATFDEIDISWSYHPDNGLDIVIHKN
jgi:hypothetical protein